MDNRGIQQNDRWSGNVGLQQDSRPGFTAPITGGLVSNVPANMYVASALPQPGGMFVTGPLIAAAGRQPEQRFDAYKNMPPGGGLRRY